MRPRSPIPLCRRARRRDSGSSVCSQSRYSGKSLKLLILLVGTSCLLVGQSQSRFTVNDPDGRTGYVMLEEKIGCSGGTKGIVEASNGRDHVSVYGDKPGKNHFSFTATWHFGNGLYVVHHRMAPGDAFHHKMTIMRSRGPSLWLPEEKCAKSNQGGVRGTPFLGEGTRDTPYGAIKVYRYARSSPGYNWAQEFAPAFGCLEVYHRVEWKDKTGAVTSVNETTIADIGTTPPEAMFQIPKAPEMSAYDFYLQHPTPPNQSTLDSLIKDKERYEANRKENGLTNTE